MKGNKTYCANCGPIKFFGKTPENCPICDRQFSQVNFFPCTSCKVQIETKNSRCEACRRDADPSYSGKYPKMTGGGSAN